MYDIVSSFPTDEKKFDIDKLEYKENEYFVECKKVEAKNSIASNSFYVTCLKTAQYMKELSTVYAKDDENKRCKYLNYCANDAVRNEKNSHNETKFMSAYKDLTYELKICEGKFDYMDDIIFKRVKNLHDIYYEYKKFMNIIQSPAHQNCPDFKNCVNMYSTYIGTCNDQNHRDFCGALQKFKTYHLQNMIRILIKCDDNDVALPSPEIPHAHNHEDRDGHFDLNEADPSEMSPDSYPPYNTAIFTVSIILVITFTFFILYKFTLFGLWLEPRIRKIKKILPNLIENKNILKDFKRKHINLQNSPYNVQYHVAENS
ncbi:Plasmodium vivax Vir protein, putative [Plasmodium ovale]|uniref:Plasmodium vivax Vir protein, putative n=1 Tax=Plasmodium ovale TaxID=36330 RepID=A0A1C3KHC5_PLAOA|nr:Plasmodium vivax Vir protein, putative [Plasmodium ovale]